MSYCNWDHTSAINIAYHDTEWGVPLHDDRMQFEYLSLEVMQCGLNWDLIINKRSVLRSCFDNFDTLKIQNYNQNDIDRIIKTPHMIKSQRKILAIIHNASCFEKIKQEFKSFDNYLWSFTAHKTVLYEKHEDGYIPAFNGLSFLISKDLKKRGFKFLGPVTIYSHLQACGMINDHAKDCPRRAFICQNFPTVSKKCDNEKDVHFFG